LKLFWEESIKEGQKEKIENV
jgi:hypothetical protein